MGDQTSFCWRGHDQRGYAASGMLQADTRASAVMHLHRLGIRIESLYQAGGPAPAPPRRRKSTTNSSPGDNAKPRRRFLSRTPGAATVVLFYQQLAPLLTAGLPILQALRLTVDSLPAGQLVDVTREVANAVEEGRPLSDAMAQWPGLFDRLSISLIRSGETAGALDTAVHRVATTHERSIALRRKVRSAMIYPATVVATALLVCALLLTKLVPQFSVTFHNMGAELPSLTQAVVELSEWAVSHGAYWLLGVGLASMAALCLHRRYPSLRRLTDRAVIRIPVLGALVRASCLARIFQTLATTLASGLPLLDALRSSAGVAGNHVFHEAMLSLAEHTEQGHRLGKAVRQNQLFPVMIAQLIETGEESGTLDSMLRNCATLCQDQVEESVDTLTTLMEPAIMLVLGVLTGGLMLAMYLPIFQLGAVL